VVSIASDLYQGNEDHSHLELDSENNSGVSSKSKIRIVVISEDPKIKSLFGERKEKVTGLVFIDAYLVTQTWNIDTIVSLGFLDVRLLHYDRIPREIQSKGDGLERPMRLLDSSDANPAERRGIR